LREALPGYLRGLVTFAYRSGWRVSEIKGLTWRQVDLAQGIVTLNPGETKNNEARTIYLDDQLREVFESQREAQKKRGRVLPFVFTNEAGTGHLKEFRKTWATACKRAKIGNKLFHDFRRTACRNMVRAGIPERVAMQISGHKTRSIFDRYNIVNDSDLRAAAEKQAAYLDKKVAAVGHNLGTIAPFPAKKRGRQTPHKCLPTNE